MAGHLVQTAGLAPGGAASGEVRVRETDGGFVIHSPDPGGQARHVLMRAARLTIRVAWIAAAGLWLVRFAPDPQTNFALKGVATAGLLALAHYGAAMIRRPRWHVVHVDTRRRQLCRAAVTPQGESQIKDCFDFDEIGAAVLERGPARGDPFALCLRLKGRLDVIPVAEGDEAVLLAVHDRLMRNLRPVEERVAARGLPERPARSARARQAFPMLGPSETGRRARRATLR